MVRMLSLVPFLAAATAQDAAPPPAGADVSTMGAPITKTIVGGPIVGRVAADGIEYYFGIPTAEDTTGANRFKAPVPKQPWTAPLETTHERVCTFATGGPSDPVVGSEDCVSVDVMTVTGAVDWPVFVYIHGGGFNIADPMAERATHAYYQKGGAPHLNNEGKVVTVWFHYRLGSMGALALPGLSTETTYGGSGNWHIMDSINNLQWIQSNIAFFGGDPGKVTIQGESAGAATVMMITASPLSEGLFVNAIADSPYISYKPGSFGLSARYTLNRMIVVANGCGTIETVDPGEVACLRSKPAGMLTGNIGYMGMAAFDAVYGSGAGYTFLYNSVHNWPVVDGYVYSVSPTDHWAAGVSSNVHFIIGHNADEYTLFYFDSTVDYEAMPYPIVDRAYLLAQDNIGLQSSVTEIIGAIYGTLATTVMGEIDGYYSDIINPYDKAVQTCTDAWFESQIKFVVNILNGQSGRTPGTVFKFLFAQEPAASVAPYLPGFGAYHASDLNYVQGWYSIQKEYLMWSAPYPVSYTDDENALGVTMKKYWLNFMYTGNPNVAGDGLPGTWPAVTSTDRHMIVFKASYQGGAAIDPCVNLAQCRNELTADYRAAASAFWMRAEPATASTECSAGTSGPSKAAFAAVSGLSCPSPPPAPSPPAATGPCRLWCKLVPKPWGDKCLWSRTCSGCPPCTSGGTCKSWCSRGNMPWSTKCAWRTCSACGPCSQPQCAQWCGAHPKSWDDKCSFDKCRGCAPCSEI